MKAASRPRAKPAATKRRNGVPSWMDTYRQEWSWDEVLPFYRLVEDDPGGVAIDPDGHGAGGSLPIDRIAPSGWQPFHAAFHDACRANGFVSCPDLNSPGANGVGVFPRNKRNGVRMSTALTYIAEARHRSNLTLLPNAHVDCILIEHGRAISVEVIQAGKRMRIGGGRITLAGNAGMHLGAYMAGGSIEVTGSASDWVGAEMTGGLIRIAGNAGGQIGAAYRGSQSGMRDGTILVGGTAGLEVGMRMKRGIIAIGGLVRDFAGLQMKGGTIILGSGAELRTGAWMMRGTIISLRQLPLLPTFSYAATYMPTFLRLYASYLGTLGFALPCDGQDGAYQRYTGDTSVPGKGEILIWSPRGA